MTQTVLCVFGTRPEAIKLAPVIRELRRRPEDFRCRVCVTAQHRDMLDQVLRLFKIVVDYDLDVMKTGQTPVQVAAAVLAGLEPVLAQERPDWVLVQGDTTTVAAAALAAYYAGARVGHVEAGLRSYDKWQPFPEEVNRRIAGVVADLHFAPTELSRRNLLAEGVPDADVRVTGNPVIDALHWSATLPPDDATRVLLADVGVDGSASGPRLVLLTAHRRESFGAPLERICAAVRELAERYASDLRFVYPVHPNPNVQEPVHRLLGNVPGVRLVPPLDYLPLVHLMRHCALVLTDSGGIQEEAPSLGKPVLVLRDVTERPEGIEAGVVKLVGTCREAIVGTVSRLLDDPVAYREMATAVSPYGDGQASRRIADALCAGERPPPARLGAAPLNAEVVA